MTLLLDALEEGFVDLGRDEIAETTGLPKEHVYTLVSRGFRRLDRVAADEGLEITLSAELNLGDPEELSDDDTYEREEYFA